MPVVDLEVEPGQRVEDRLLGPGQVVAQLGMGVEGPPQLDPGAELLCGLGQQFPGVDHPAIMAP